MNRLFLTINIVAGLFVFGNANAQQFNNTALAAKATQFTQEVQGPCTQYTSAAHISANAQLLSRVEIKTQAYQANEGYKTLSSLMMVNKCVPTLQSDVNNFDPNNFNPLKYFMNFTLGVSTTYRVDNSNYVIVIHP